MLRFKIKLMKGKALRKHSLHEKTVHVLEMLPYMFLFLYSKIQPKPNCTPANTCFYWEKNSAYIDSCLTPHSTDLQGSNRNVAFDTSSQYGDHFCEIVLKSNFK